MTHQFSVVEFPEIKIVGMQVKTDMTKATTECPALWQAFSPRICGELAGCTTLSQKGVTYGVSKMVDEQHFNYWAAIGVDAVSATLPKEMDSMTIPQGLYVKCKVASLEQLGDAYMGIYTQWPSLQNEYALDMQGISFELYLEGWKHEDAFELYVSVIKK